MAEINIADENLRKLEAISFAYAIAVSFYRKFILNRLSEGEEDES